MDVSVHMNGRIYDPLIARFMSADPFIQDPLHSQSYNRYSYVWNNPTNLTDPTGFLAIEADAQADRLQREADKRATDCANMGGNCEYSGPGQVQRNGEVSPTNSKDPSGKSPQNATAQTASATNAAVNPSGFTNAEEQMIKTSIADHKDTLLKMRASLARWDANDQADFQLAFGTQTAAAKKEVSDDTEKQIVYNKSLTVANFVRGTAANAPKNLNLSTTFAWVRPSDPSKIYLADLFWTASAKGVDSRVGTLLHEISHFTSIGGTKDFFSTYLSGAPVYGKTDSHALAVANPALALKHADSFEYWGESR